MGDVLEVRVAKAVFAKDLNYFLSLQLNEMGEKLRTEVSEPGSKPVFKNDTFSLRVREVASPRALRRGEGELVLRVAGFVILNKDDNGQGVPSLLGSGSVNVSAMLEQLEGGRKVLCDDVALTRKSKKPGQEQDDIVVGKLQLELRFDPGLDESDLIPQPLSVHPGARLCRVMVHHAELGQQVLDEQERLHVETRVIAPEAHQALMAFREDPEQRETWAKFWPARQEATRGARADEGGRFVWNESARLRLEARAAERNKAIRVDLVPLPQQDGYDPADVEWRSLGGATLALGFLRKLQQYNLQLCFSEHARLLVSVELLPSQSEEQALFAAQDRDNLRRVQVTSISLVDNLPCTARAAFVHVRGEGAPIDPAAPLVSPFLLRKPLVKPMSVNPAADVALPSRPLLECSAGLQECAPTGKISQRATGDSKRPSWPAPELEFNAEGEAFADQVQVALYHEADTLLAFGSLSLRHAPTDGTEHKTVINLTLTESGQAAAPPAAVDDAPADSLDGEGLERTTVRCAIKWRVWAAPAFREHLEGGIAEKRVSKADLERAEKEREMEAKRKQDELAALRKKRESLNAGKTSDTSDPFADLATTRAPVNQAADLNQSQQMPSGPRASAEDAVDPRATITSTPATPALTPGPSRDVTPEQEAPESTPAQPPQAAAVHPIERHESEESLRSPSRAASRERHKMTAEQVHALEERMGILTADLANKQTLIDRLIAEVDKRSEAIRSCGAEIVALRKANAQLEQERDSAFQEMQAMREDAASEARALASPVPGDSHEGLSEADLKRRLTVLGQKYLRERERNEDLMPRMRALQESAVSHRGLMRQHEKLQQAHAAQGRCMQELQEKNAEIGIFRATIKTQEKVILKLEDLLESKLRENGGDMGADLHAELQRLRERNADLEDKLLHGDFIGDDSLRERVHELEEELQRAREAGPEADDDAQERIAALEEQLVNNAKNFAREIAEARMKIFEYEAVHAAE